MIEETLMRVSKILKIVGCIVLLGFLLFTIEAGFLFGSFSILLWIYAFGGDIEPIILLLKFQGFLFQFALMMFLFGLLAWLIAKVMKGQRERREKFAQDKMKAIEEIKQQVLADLKKSRRRK